jgi:hypothetical protein
LVLGASKARAEEHAPEPPEEPERHYVFGLGGVFSYDLGGPQAKGGGNAFFEMVAIEHWLDIEAGVTVLRSKPGGEFTYDLLLKKPFELRKNVEFMVGLGPEIVQTFGSGVARTYYGLEGVMDFMVWPTRHVGFWIAPGWDLVVRDRAELGVGTTAGAIVGW